MWDDHSDFRRSSSWFRLLKDYSGQSIGGKEEEIGEGGRRGGGKGWGREGQRGKKGGREGGGWEGGRGKGGGREGEGRERRWRGESVREGEEGQICSTIAAQYPFRKRDFKLRLQMNYQLAYRMAD